MPAERPAAVYFFGTCLIDLFYPQAGLAGMELLRRQGIRVIFPQDQSCCGQPAYNSGYRDEARRVAARQIACFPEDLPLVVPSGSCAGMMKHHYPGLFADHALQGEAEALAARVYELTEFLVDVLDFRPTDLGPPVKLAIHSSCSARREMGVADRIERLVGDLGQVTLVEQHHASECCGFGGTFAVKQPETSAAMVADKCDAIRETGTEVLVGQDCGCLMNIGGALDKGGSDIRTLHIAEFLLERSGGPPHGRE